MFNVNKKSTTIPYGSNAYSALLGNNGGDLLKDKSYSNYIKVAVKGNPVVAACLNFIITNLYTIPILLVEEKDEENIVIKSHPILDLIKNPNKYQEGKDFWQLHYTYMYANGDTLVRKMDVNGEPIAMILYRPGAYDITINPTNFENLVVYKETKGGTVIPYDESFLRKFVDPDDEFAGLGAGSSPLEPSAKYIVLNNKYVDWNHRVLDNSGKPSGAFVVKKTMDKMAFERMQEEINQMYAGINNAGKISVLHGEDGTLQTFDERTDSSWINGFQMTAQKIATSLGLDPGLVGDQSNKTYSNFKEANRKAYTDLIIPLKEEELDFLNEFIVADYNKKSSIKLKLVIDYKNVVALQKDLTDLIKALRGATYLTEKQKQAMIGTEPDEDRDIYVMPSSTVEVNSENGERTGNNIVTLAPEEEVVDDEKQKIIKKKVLSSDVYKRTNDLKIQHEEDLQPKIENFLVGQGKRIVASLVKNEEKAFSVEVNDLLRDIDWEEEALLLNGVMEPTLTSAYINASRDIASIFNFQAASVEISSAKIRDQILERSVFVTESTQDKVSQIIADGLEDGKSIAAIANEISDYVEGSNVARAKVIATTEVGSAVNSGVFETYKNEGVKEHEYITAGDGDVRHTHAAQDGVIVEIGELFPNGLRYPNEYGAPPAEVIGCRCITLPVEE